MSRSAVHPAGDEVVQNLLLLLHGGTGEKAKIQIHIAEILHGVITTIPDGGPEIVFRIGDEGQLEFFLPGIVGRAAVVSAVILVATLAETQDAQDQNQEEEYLFHRISNVTPSQNYYNKIFNVGIFRRTAFCFTKIIGARTLGRNPDRQHANEQTRAFLPAQSPSFSQILLARRRGLVPGRAAARVWRHQPEN